MRGNPELVVLKNIYCLAAVLILVSSFAGCAAGSCLSYGHSCWGAHGKRSGAVRPMENLVSDSERRIAPAPLSYGERWLLSRLVSRQLMQTPWAAKLRARMMVEQPLALIPQSLDEESDVAAAAAAAADASGIKHSATMDKLSEYADVRDLAKGEPRMREGESDIYMLPPRKDFTDDNDQSIKVGLYKILKNIDEKLK